MGGAKNKSGYVKITVFSCEIRWIKAQVVRYYKYDEKKPRETGHYFGYSQIPTTSFLLVFNDFNCSPSHKAKKAQQRLGFPSVQLLRRAAKAGASTYLRSASRSCMKQAPPLANAVAVARRSRGSLATGRWLTEIDLISPSGLTKTAPRQAQPSALLRNPNRLVTAFQ